MELNGCEQVSLISELTQGMDLTKQLKAEMGPEVSGESRGALIDGILSTYQNALAILKLGGSMEQSQQHVVPSTNVPGSPLSVIESPKSEDTNPGINPQHNSRDFSRKRKMMPSWTERVKASSENGMEGPPDDSFSWRKYGQKDILGAQYPRSYYRCTYRNIQGCCAIKQVQRSDEDPSVFDITYKGRHTCTQTPRSKSAPTSPKNPENNKKQNIPITDQYQQRPDVMLNFQAGLSVDVQNLDVQEMAFPTNGSGYESHTLTPSAFSDNNFYGSFTPSFTLSPATSESTYFSTSPYKMSALGIHHGHSESDIAEIISATTSGTNSPIIGIDFHPDQLEFNPSFPFDNQLFFPSSSQTKE